MPVEFAPALVRAHESAVLVLQPGQEGHQRRLGSLVLLLDVLAQRRGLIEPSTAKRAVEALRMLVVRVQRQRFPVALHLATLLAAHVVSGVVEKRLFLGELPAAVLARVNCWLVSLEVPLELLLRHSPSSTRRADERAGIRVEMAAAMHEQMLLLRKGLAALLAHERPLSVVGAQMGL